MGRFEVTLHGGEVVSVDEADAYQPEGPLTTFFCRGSSRATIDSWSVRVASFRTSEVLIIRRHLEEPVVTSRPRHVMAPELRSA